ncbi:MAG: extracellular solute-binding protein [Deltaproteobacteria bacterium]|nr:extracellular solute-binding protein [Deltaproteobacteria bacterium]
MRRLRAVAALLVAAALAGCEAPARTLTLAAALLPSELPAYRTVLDDFERAHGWRVVVVPQQYADIRRALAAEAVAGAGTLDLVELDIYSLAAAARDVTQLDEAGLAAELAALAAAPLQAGRIDGLRFLPHRLTWQALIYDHAALGAPPGTWDELLAVARAHPGRIGIKGALYEGLTCDVLPFVWAAGGSGVAFDDAGARAAFRLFAALAPALNRQSATFREASIAEAMARGELVLHLNWPFAMSLFAAQGRAPRPLRSAPLPRGPAGTATVLGGGYLAIPRGAPHPRMALALARYLLGAAAQQALHERLGWFSARRDVATGDGDELLAGFAALRDAVRPRPELPDYALLSRLWQDAFRAVAFQRVAPETALADAAARWAARPRRGG